MLLLYFAAAVRMSFRLPAHATPNELLNYEYVAVMRQIHGLPNRGLVDSEVRYTEWHQPPVYFTFAAMVGLPIPVPRSPVNPPPPIEVQENPFYLSTPHGNLNPVVHITPQTTPLLYLSRLAAALMGMVGVATLYRAGAQIYAPWVGLLMAALLAFQPGYVHLSGSVNNDMPLTAVAAVVLSYAALLVHRQASRPQPPPRYATYFVLGLLGALAILTKANGVFVLAFLGLTLLSSLLIYRRWTLTLVYAGSLALGLLPLWVGWLALNTIRMRDTLGLSGSLPVGRVLALSPLDFVHLQPFLPAIWRSFWLDWSAGDVGYGPDWLYLFWLVALVAALLGWLRPNPTPGGRSGLFVTLLVVAGFLSISYLYFAVKALTVKEAGYLVPEGRWWLPAMPALAWLAAVGYSRWWSPRRQEAACLIASAVPVVFLYGLLLFHLPALYPQAERLAAQVIPSIEPGDLIYNGALALSGVELEELIVGRPATATLIWEALQPIDRDYTVSTQLLALAAGGWQKLAEHNSYPGQGLNPTRGWMPGIVRDRLTMVPAGDLNGPTEVALAVWVYDGERPAVARRDDQPVEPPLAARTTARPANPVTIPETTMVPVSFGPAITLRYVSVEPAAGGPVVDLYWEAGGEPGADYTIFVHLLDAAGNLVAQADGPPNGGLSPTRIWRAGDVIYDRHQFAPGVTMPPGGRLLVGVYQPETGERLPATQAGQTLPDNALELRLDGE